MYGKLALLRSLNVRSGAVLVSASRSNIKLANNAARPFVGSVVSRLNGHSRSICTTSGLLAYNHTDFSNRHIGPREEEKAEMLKKIGFKVSTTTTY